MKPEPQREAATPARSRLRLFLALDLPAERRAALHGWAQRSFAAEGLRVVRAEALHVTLAFLGHHPAAVADRVAAILGSVEPRPVAIAPFAEPQRVPRSRPRLVALGLEAPAAAEIQAELVPPLVAAGLYEPERRPFWPHVTLVRARAGRHAAAARRALRRDPPALPGELRAPFGAVRLALYRSSLRPDGAEYVSLANLDLPPVANQAQRGER